MRNYLFAGAFVLTGLMADMTRADVIYNLVPEVVTQDAITNYNVVGTITTDGTLGTLDADDKVSFSWTATEIGGPNIFSASGLISTAESYGTFTATATGLYLAFPPVNKETNFVDFGDAGAQGTNLEFDTVDGFGDWQPELFTFNDSRSFQAVWQGTDTFTQPTPFEFATAVPEPASFSLLGLAGLITIRRPRRAVAKA